MKTPCPVKQTNLRPTADFTRTLKNIRHRLNVRDRKFVKPLERRNPGPILNSSLQLPCGWKMIAMRRVSPNTTQLGIYLYREVYFLNFVIPPHVDSPKFDAQTSTFTLLHSATPYCYVQFLRLLESLMARFSRPAFLKIRFRGKGYYMYKTRRNTIAPNFGYAHRVYVYAPALSVLFLSKTKILLFGLSPKEIIGAGHRVKATKPINIFTGRGVRFARQTIYKKTGKVSSYR